MKAFIFSLLIVITPLGTARQSPVQSTTIEPLARPAGLIVARPKVNESFSKDSKPLTIRIINQGEKTVYLPGVRQVSEKGKVQLYFYHRRTGGGWKPYFDSLPCNLPTCRNLHSLSRSCGEGEPVVIRLGGKGSHNSVKEFQWGGLLYERSEATREGRSRRYCYTGWAPNRGQVRVEVEYSKTVSRNQAEKEVIEGRDYTAIEFDLPASEKVYEIILKG